MRIFSVVLGSIILIELWAANLASITKVNGLAYNVLDFVWFPIYMVIFRQLLHNQKFKNKIDFLIGLFYLAATINFFLLSDHIWLAHRIFLLGGISVVICSLFAFNEITHSRAHHDLKSDPLFWISCAMLVYFLPSSIVIGGFEYFQLQDIPMTKSYGSTFIYSQNILNPIHYSLLSYAFVCGHLFGQPISNS